MADRPILFSAPMIRALLAGTKTQTRRLLPTAHPRHPNCNQIRMDVLIYDPQRPEAWYWDGVHDRAGASYLIPYAPGDRLWVREGHSLHNAHGQHRDDGNRWGPWGGLPMAINPEGDKVAYYREGFDRCDGGPWRPSIHMPRWASRLTLTVTEVRVQRLQEISEADAVAEGIELYYLAGLSGWTDYGSSDGMVKRYFADPRKSYASLWESLNGPGAWEANPWVVAVSFDVRKGNIDG